MAARCSRRVHRPLTDTDTLKKWCAVLLIVLYIVLTRSLTAGPLKDLHEKGAPVQAPWTHLARLTRSSIPSYQAGKTRSALQDVVTREYTIHLHKLVHGRSFKKRAPHAVKSVIAFAQKAMGTADVRVDPRLNQQLWERGIKSPPRRIRVKLERAWCLLVRGMLELMGLGALGKRNDEENAKEKLYTYASFVPVESFKVRPTVCDPTPSSDIIA